MPSNDVVVLRRAGLATLIVGVVAAVIGFAVASGKGLFGAALGAVIVLAFFSIGQVVVGRVIRTNPEMAMTVALMTYLIKVGALFVLLLVLQGTTAFNTKVFAATIVACTITWTACEVWYYANTKVLVVEPSSTRPPGGPQ